MDNALANITGMILGLLVLTSWVFGLINLAEHGSNFSFILGILFPPIPTVIGMVEIIPTIFNAIFLA